VDQIVSRKKAKNHLGNQERKITSNKINKKRKKLDNNNNQRQKSYIIMNLFRTSINLKINKKIL